MTIGTELRQAREERGLSLRDLSERTNIRQSILRAIETDDFRHLPGGVITRGFLRLYAREVGLDPDAIWQRCATEIAALERGGPDDADAATGLAHGGTATPGARSRRPMMAVVGAVAVLAALAVGYVRSRPPTGDATTTEAPPPVGLPPAEAEQPAPATIADPAAAATIPRDAAPGSGEVSPDILRVDLHATGPCWVAATADGQQVVYRQMNAGDRESIRVKREVVLRIGMPANLAVSLNDEPLPPAARPGTPVTLRLTPGNYREALAR